MGVISVYASPLPWDVLLEPDKMNNSDTDKRTPESQAASLPPVWFITRSHRTAKCHTSKQNQPPFWKLGHCATIKPRLNLFLYTRNKRQTALGTDLNEEAVKMCWMPDLGLSLLPRSGMSTTMSSVRRWVLRALSGMK